MTTATMTPIHVISNPDAHQERIVISDFNAPTRKCAAKLMPKEMSYRSHATHEKEWNDRNKSADRSGDGSRDRRGPLIRETMLGQAELALRHGLHELLRLLRQALRHFLRLFRSESLQLIEERHLLDFFLRIFLYLCALARNLRFVNFRLALCGKVSACAHRKRGSEHSRKPGNQNVMLLVVRRAGHA